MTDVSAEVREERMIGTSLDSGRCQKVSFTWV
jgi:hypothetical protein